MDTNPNSKLHRFSARVSLILVSASLASAILAPTLKTLLQASGIEVTLGQLFDRATLLCLVVGILLNNSSLGFVSALKLGFASPKSNIRLLARGLIAGLFGVGILCGLLVLSLEEESGRHVLLNTSPNSSLLVSYIVLAVLGAMTISAIEEAFFRAFLLSGVQQELGRSGGLLLTSVIYAASHFASARRGHLVNSPEWASGLILLLSTPRRIFTFSAVPGLVGLTLLGAVLGRAFQLTGSVYFSVGLHAGVVLGVRLWRLTSWSSESRAPEWLSGYGWPPLVSSPLAWCLLLVLFFLLPRLVSVRSPYFLENHRNNREPQSS